MGQDNPESLRVRPTCPTGLRRDPTEKAILINQVPLVPPHFASPHKSKGTPVIIPRANHRQRMVDQQRDVVKLSSQEQANMIVALLADLCEPESLDQLGKYLQHVGFDLSALRQPQDLVAAWLGHYRIRQGVYDVERAFNDLATYPPMASEIARLQALQRKV